MIIILKDAGDWYEIPLDMLCATTNESRKYSIQNPHQLFVWRKQKLPKNNTCT